MTRLVFVAACVGLSTGCAFLSRYDTPTPLSQSSPDLAGHVTSRTADWLIAGQGDPADQHVDLTFEAAGRGVAEGGGLEIMLGHVLPTDQQIYTPFSLTATSAYFFRVHMLKDVEATSSNKDVRLRVEPARPGRSMRDVFRYVKYKRSDEGEVHRDSLLRQIDNDDAVRITVVRGALAPGDTIDVRIGKKGGLTAPTHEAELQIVVRLDGDGDGTFGLLADAPSFQVYSREVDAVELLAPSTLVVGETSHMTLRVEDGEFLPNLARFQHAHITMEPADGLEFAPVLDVSGSLTSWDGCVTQVPVTARTPGLYRLRGAIEVDGKTLQILSNPIQVTAEPPAHRVYFGDLHVHSVLSYDADRPPQYVYERMRGQERYDFASLSDHDMIGAVPFAPRTGIQGRNDSEWAYARQIADQFNEPGSFVTLYAYEWTSYFYGHRNVYWSPTEVDPPLVHHNQASRFPEKPDELAPVEMQERLQGHDYITIPHSTAWPTGDQHFHWGPYSNDLGYFGSPRGWMQQRLVEMYSTHGTSEFFNNEYATDKGHAEAPIKSRLIKGLMGYNIRQAPADSGNFVRDALGAGWRMGFVADSDEHYLSHINQAYGYGATAVIAPELTREALWGAMESRHTYAVTGARILLDFQVEDAFMGDALALGGRTTVHLRGAIHGVRELDFVQVIKFDGKQWSTPWALDVDGVLDTDLDWTDPTAAPGQIYYLRVRQKDGEYAWSSPVWLDP